MLCVLVACGKEDSSNKGSKDGDKINVSTTVYPLQSFIKQIGGNHECIIHLSCWLRLT